MVDIALARQVTAAELPRAVALRVDAVEKSFAGRPALRGVTFEVAAGQRVALLGPNGAGKTTLVRSICGRVRIDAGSIQLFRRSIRDAGVLGSLGVVPQELAIYGDLTAAENLQIFGRLNGLSGPELRRRVEWALEWIALADRRNHLTRTFSGGMRRRVNIACGVMHSPAVLLLDEPTVGVDPQSRQRIFDMLSELTAAGTTIVLTTHHLDEAETQCDRILIVDGGRIIADGTLHELIDRTVGDRQHLDLTIEGLDGTSVPRLRFDEASGTYRTSVRSPQAELPVLLSQIAERGGRVLDMRMRRSDLHQVFLHLTGRELRE